MMRTMGSKARSNRRRKQRGHTDAPSAGSAPSVPAPAAAAAPPTNGAVAQSATRSASGPHVPADPGRQKASALTQFDRWAVWYDRSILNEFVFYPAVRACQKAIREWNAARGGRPFTHLDVGCGTGTLLSVMADDPAADKLVGLDYSPEMVRRAEEKFTRCRTPGKLSVVQGDAEFLPFEPGSFDVITCCNSFHHYPRQQEVVHGFRKALRPGGLLVLIDGFRDNFFGWVVFALGVELVEKHVHHCTWREFQAMFAEAGFSDLRQHKINVFSPLLVNRATAP